MRTGLRTLVLNSNFMPISVFPDLYTIPAEEAISRYLNDSCNVIYWYDRIILTSSRNDLKWPSVIVNRNTKSFGKELKLKKSSLFYRDQCSCVYCGNFTPFPQITYDHVIPKEKGGKHMWENVSISCHNCNNKKGNSLPVGKWKPKQKPYKPTFFDILEKRKKFPVTIYDEKWKDFLPGFVEYKYKEDNK